MNRKEQKRLEDIATSLLKRKAPAFMMQQKMSDAKRRAMYSHHNPDEVIKWKAKSRRYT